MLIRKQNEIASSEITSKAVWDAYRHDRREFLRRAGLATAGAGLAAALPRAAYALTKLNVTTSKYTVPDAVTPEAKAQSYNNYYEFGTDKSDPARNATKFRTRPWTIKVEGLVKKPQTVDIDTVAAYRPMESRTYRFRCVEAWSMIIPWDGYPLSEFINAMNPLPSAKYVQFLSDADTGQMQLPGGFNWPYSEGLRMDEAMNPLTLLTFGSYGETLANQQGAPVRVIVPWKYGFKSAKAIVKIRFVDKQPPTTWNEMAPDEYGFYSNVNPSVDHPRWSQAHERRIDSSSSLFPKTVPTQPFNGYGNEVAGMYAGMDLRKFF